EDQKSDPYATGSVLFALRRGADLAPEDKVYRRGLKFLLDAQHDDGSWYVKSRSKPFQTYYESGYPHKKDQFISMAAGSWATLALLFAVEKEGEPD
ncbi:MAG: N-acyl-D-aspartate/D-glutamate deacylase, partial [Verrucomicrobiota bacterium]|nr:N-acyl-D-aspartate/D-glutamate deacylase [Verrucomicrobiota bacterium]